MVELNVNGAAMLFDCVPKGGPCTAAPVSCRSRGVSHGSLCGRSSDLSGRGPPPEIGISLALLEVPHGTPKWRY